MSVAARRSARPAAVPATSVAATDAGAAAAAEVPPLAYVGLVTRALAFALDAAVINAVAILTAAVVALTFSVVTIPHELQVAAAAAGGAIYVLWTIGYFVTFWATTGQTPGNRVLRIRVRSVSGERLRPAAPSCGSSG